MAAKKYYGVKKGKITGVFNSWQACKESVDGYPNAEYKGFATLEEVEAYLGEQFCLHFEVQEDPKESTSGEGASEKNISGGSASEKSISGSSASKKNISWEGASEKNISGNRVSPKSTSGENTSSDEVRAISRTAERADTDKDRGQQIKSGKRAASITGELPEEGRLLAYVDGSYNDSLKRYAFGCVFILSDGRVFVEYGNGDNAQSLQHRNVTGEMLGAMYAVKFAMLNGFAGLEICYDYEGIEKWVTGGWRTKTELTAKYAASMREWARSIEVRFTKVAAHTNVYYNELADKMAKMGLTLGNGVPKVHRIEDMEEYHGTDAVE